MNMKGVTKYFKPGEADAKALQAGNDVSNLSLMLRRHKGDKKLYISKKAHSRRDIAIKMQKSTCT